MKLLGLVLLFVAAANAALVQDVRSATAARNWPLAEKLVADFQKQNGWTPEAILGQSWIARGAQAASEWDRAQREAAKTRTLVDESLKKRKLDDEPQLPLALGASIEVQALSLAGQNQRTEAVALLQKEIKAWYATSIRTRLQKNLNLLTLEGKPAPALETKQFIGPAGPTLAALKGKPIILFFWAHWCADCKQQGPILARLQQEHKATDLVILGPTQKYGYIAGGVDAPPAEELPYIERIRTQFYGSLNMAVPVSEENFKAWGCSTTPTLALIDRAGIVRLYHPGRMTYEDLAPKVAALVKK
ncbi:MAG: redoxin domain-containing protein [Acidobacteria bacterium]|nr:redoxin domain-containing protein [Acidobacteriota bacterium]